MSEQTENRTGLPVENFSQLSEFLQNGLFMAFFAMLRPFFPPRDGRWAAYQIDRIDNEYGRNERGKEALDEVLEELPKIRSEYRNYNASSLANEAINLLGEVDALFFDFHGPSHDQYYIKLREAREKCFQSWVLEFTSDTRWVYEYLLWFDGAFSPVDIGDFKKSNEMRELEEAIIPSLQTKLRNDDTPRVPDAALPKIQQAMDKFEWALAQWNADNRDRSFLEPRLLEARDLLKDIHDDEILMFTEEATRLILMVVPALIQRVDVPEVLRVHVETLLTWVRTIDEYLRDHSEFLGDLNLVIRRVVAFLDQVFEIREVQVSIWNRLTENTDIDEIIEWFKNLFHVSRDLAAQQYWNVLKG